MQKVLSIQEAAAMFPGLSASAIRRLIRSGEIHSRKIGAKYLTTPEAIENWLQGGIPAAEQSPERGKVRAV